MLKRWEDLPDFMRTPEVRPYWEALNRKRGQLALKRAFDVVVGLIIFVLLLIPMAIIAIMIKLDSPGPIFYRQERVTTYGRRFRIHFLQRLQRKAGYSPHGTEGQISCRIQGCHS